MKLKKFICIFVAVVTTLTVVFVACNREKQVEIDAPNFESALCQFSDRVGFILSQSTTRAGGITVLDESTASEIMEAVSELSIEFGLAEIITESDYYNDELPDIANMTMADLEMWFAANATPELQSLLNEDYENLTVETIISNTRLLPNERIGLLLGLGIIDPPQPSLMSLEQCWEQWKKAKQACIARFYKEVEIASCFAIFGPVGWATAGIGATIAGARYASCVSDADIAYEYCKLQVQ